MGNIMEIIIAVIGVIFIYLIFGSKLTGSSSQKNRNEKLGRRFDEEFIALEFNPNSLPIFARQVMVDAASRYVQKKSIKIQTATQTSWRRWSNYLQVI